MKYVRNLLQGKKNCSVTLLQLFYLHVVHYISSTIKIYTNALLNNISHVLIQSNCISSTIKNTFLTHLHWNRLLQPCTAAYQLIRLQLIIGLASNVIYRLTAALHLFWYINCSSSIVVRWLWRHHVRMYSRSLSTLYSYQI